VLDVGCHQGEFLRRLGNRIGPSVGLDPLAIPTTTNRYRLIAEALRESSPFADGSFDVVVMLATLEHIRDKEPLARVCRRLLRPGGRIVITVPAPFVDGIVDWLRRLRLADGMCLEEHHGFDPTVTPAVFTRQGFQLEHHHRFQLGLNHLFVFRKPTEEPTAQEAVVESAEIVGAVAHA
jgi:SAM-dependent methyltransferase